MTDLKQIIIAKAMGLKNKPEGTINEVQQQTDNMSVIEKTMDTARKLAGTDVLVGELERKDKKMEDLGKDKEKTDKELQDARLQLIQSQLGSKIDQLSETVKSGGSAKTITEQIAEIKSVASDLGLGTSKVSEFKEMANLIQSLNPHKDLTQQIKDAKDLMSILQPEKGKEMPAGAMPAEIVIQLKKLDVDFQVKLEEMRDDRQRRDQDFKLTVLKWEEDRDIRRQEVDSKILIAREQNQLISGALKTVGGAIGQGLKEGAKSQPGGISQNQQNTGKIYQFEVPENGFGTTECPNCHAPIGIGPTTTLAECVKCNTQYPVIRTPAVESPHTPEPQPTD